MSPPPSLPESVTMPSCVVSTETRWFKEQVEPHEPMLRAYIRRKFPRLSDVDDLVQEAYLRLMRAKQAGTLRSAKGFLFTTARNLALDIFRHRAVIPMEPLVENGASAVYFNGANAAETASLNQELDLLLTAIDELPDRCRQVLVLRRFHGLTNKEIAAQLSISENTVEKQMGIGLRKCMAYLKIRGVEIRRP